MKTILRNHKKDNFVTNIKQNYASALVLSFLWNLENSNTVRFGQCVICLMSLNSRSSLKKKQWWKGPKTDEKVTSLNVKFTQKLLLIKPFFLKCYCVLD